jgi:hypothetical protein
MLETILMTLQEAVFVSDQDSDQVSNQVKQLLKAPGYSKMR